MDFISKEDMKSYDGFFFYPIFNETTHIDYNIDLFQFNERKTKSNIVEKYELGDMYLIAFFKSDVKDVIKLNDNFEAVFIDPMTYIKNLIGSGLYGLMVKKTKKSEKWFKETLTNFCKNVKMYKEMIK